MPPRHAGARHGTHDKPDLFEDMPSSLAICLIPQKCLKDILDIYQRLVSILEGWYSLRAQRVFPSGRLRNVCSRTPWQHTSLAEGGREGAEQLHAAQVNACIVYLESSQTHECAPLQDFESNGVDEDLEVRATAAAVGDLKRNSLIRAVQPVPSSFGRLFGQGGPATSSPDQVDHSRVPRQHWLSG